MNTEQLQQLAQQYMGHAVNVQADDNIWVEYQGDAGRPLAEQCALTVSALGGNPRMLDSGAVEIRKLLDMVKTSKDPSSAIKELSEQNLAKMQKMQGYIRITDFADATRAPLSTEESMIYRGEIMNKATQHRVKHTKWLVVNAPSIEFAAACGMNKPTFDTFYLGACLANYARMADAVEPLTHLMSTADNVKITGAKTNLEFSIKNIGAKPCTGTLNIPDGECFSAPVKTSVNGHIRYEKSIYMGVEFPWVEFKCKDGRVEHAVSEGDDLTAKLNKILDKDAGARYFGEFAIGFNPHILHPVGSILFDEKIAGSFHLTPGQCYEDHANNGNTSDIHWDLVNIQRIDYGGGDIIMDDELIRRDGLFVPKRLQDLNPDRLKF